MTVSSPSRRFLLQTIAGVILGVVAYLRQPRWPGFFGGYIEATPLEPLIDPEEHDDQLPPNEFVTPSSDSKLVDLVPLQDALQQPSEQIELSRREFGDAYSVLEEFPVFEPHHHEGHDHPAVSHGGIYVRDAEYTYVIQLIPWCSNVWWIETRGTPEGRASCAER
ncbi:MULTISPECIES: hypothetical protein [Natrialbaceae]|uniref:hypothetical protein n=1 Tax=Natrialbaceae TaxID=1644061 RepID=UPI00207D1ABF|nr:hypothetical protein [Natronococcus sp. CG52]